MLLGINLIFEILLYLSLHYKWTFFLSHPNDFTLKLWRFFHQQCSWYRTLDVIIPIPKFFFSYNFLVQWQYYILNNFRPSGDRKDSKKIRQTRELKHCWVHERIIAKAIISVLPVKLTCLKWLNEIHQMWQRILLPKPSGIVQNLSSAKSFSESHEISGKGQFEMNFTKLRIS